MTGSSPIADLNVWAAEVVADPPAPTDDDRLGDWAIQVVALAQEDAPTS